MPAFIDLTGQRFGRFTVLGMTGERRHRAIIWRVRCDCGEERETPAGPLKYGVVVSCGCKKRETGSKSPLFRGWGELGSAYWNKVVRGAVSRGLEVTLAPEEAWQLYLDQDKRCAFTGVPIVLIANQGRNKIARMASLDRIDSSQGYHLSNVQWVCKEANMAKQQMSDADFIRLCQEVAAHAERN